MKTALIIGSNSFTGSHLVQLCLEKGYRVIGISRSGEYPKVMLPYLYAGNRSSDFSFFRLDVNKNLKEILKICDDNEPEVIANFAAQGEVRSSWDNPSQWYETNTIAIVKLTDELRKRTYVKRYLTASTPEVYGSTSDNLKENHNYSPSTPYAASKLAGDLHLMTLYKRYKFPVIFTRSANVYGIHQQLTGDVYHIAPEGDDVSIYEVVKTICDMMGYDFNNSVELIDQNFGQDSKYSISSSKLMSDLNWRPSISLQTGIEEMIEWIDNNWFEVSKMPLEYIHKK